MEKNTWKLKFFYWVMYRLMDLESIIWAIGECIVYPVAILRRKMARIIKNNL